MRLTRRGEAVRAIALAVLLLLLTGIAGHIAR